jgi:branched-chain amino acid transport system substrate-binding protein
VACHQFDFDLKIAFKGDGNDRSRLNKQRRQEMKKIKKAVGSRRDFLRKATALTGATVLPGFPAIVSSQPKPIRMGQVTISSGRVAQLGVSSRNAILLEIDTFNKAGGLDGRMLELVSRDSKGKPDDAARYTRELISSEGCDIILDCEGSSGAFAVHEVIRDSKALGIHCLSETSQLTADPKLKIPNAFRTARQAVHDSIVGGSYAAKIVKEQGLTRWATIASDYSYGREATPEFLHYVRAGGAKVEVVAESWPKLFQPDYTENIVKLLQAKPQVVFCGLWGGDLVTFIDQANLFNLFNNVKLFSIHMADYTTLTTIKNLPKSGLYSSNRYVKNFPNTAANKAWSDAYQKHSNSLPTNWSWEASTGARAVIAAIRQTKSADPVKLAAAMRGMQIQSPVGVQGQGTITMRASDQTIVDYALGWGEVRANDPYLVNVTPANWREIIALETEWKKKNNFI